MFLLAIIGFFSLNSFAVHYNPNPKLSAEIVEKMEEFCTKAGGTVALFENTCANACILYNRKSGKKEDISQCTEGKIYSCRCPENQCLNMSGNCETIQL